MGVYGAAKHNLGIHKDIWFEAFILSKIQSWPKPRRRKWTRLRRHTTAQYSPALRFLARHTSSLNTRPFSNHHLRLLLPRQITPESKRNHCPPPARQSRPPPPIPPAAIPSPLPPGPFSRLPRGNRPERRLPCPGSMAACSASQWTSPCVSGLFMGHHTPGGAGGALEREPWTLLRR